MFSLRSLLAGLTVCVALLAVAHAHAQTPAQSPGAADSRAADMAAIRAISGKWKELYAAGRFAEIPDLYTQDTLVMPRGRPRVEGREQMRRAIGGLAAGRRVSIDLTERELVLSGIHAWVVSDFTVTYTAPNAATPPVTELGRSLVVFRRDADGQWRIHRDMDSPAPQPPAPAVAAVPAAATMAAAPAAAPAMANDARATAPVAPRTRPVPAMWNPASRTEVTACDRLASSRYDRLRLAPPKAREDIDVPAAIQQCEADLLRFPADPRITFNLGRLYGYAGDKQKTLERREASAAAGNHNTIFLLGYLDWIAAKDDGARCAAAREMKLAADRGNYSGQITYATFYNEGRFAACEDRATKAEVAAYVEGARPAVDGFFETRLMEHLAWELKEKK
jgi:ketosteroid isomerase-like protein